jgi:hypothetical protein
MITSKDKAAIAAVRAGITERRSAIDCPYLPRKCEHCGRTFVLQGPERTCCGDHIGRNAEWLKWMNEYGPTHMRNPAARPIATPSATGEALPSECPFCNDFKLPIGLENHLMRTHGYSTKRAYEITDAWRGDNPRFTTTPEAQRSPETGSLTPRTDAQVQDECPNELPELEYVSAQFARQLERELALATDAADKGDSARRLAGAMEAEIGELRAVNEMQRKAAELLKSECDEELAASEAAKLAAETERDSWLQWAREVLTDYRREFDDHAAGLRAGLAWLLFHRTQDLAASQAREAALRTALENLLTVSENADETGYVDGEGWLPLDAIQKAAREALALETEG